MNVFASSLLFLLSSGAFAASWTPSAPKPSASVTIDGVEFDVVMQGPHAMITPLQIFGVFQFTEKGDGFSGADLEVDEGFHGLIQKERKIHRFGQLGEHLILTPPKDGGLGAKKFLVVGLGDAAKFRADDMKLVAASELRVACSMGLTDYSHASDVQDGGVTRISAGVIADSLTRGLIEELRNQRELHASGAVDDCKVQKIVYLAGPKYIKETIATLQKIAADTKP